MGFSCYFTGGIRHEPYIEFIAQGEPKCQSCWCKAFENLIPNLYMITWFLKVKYGKSYKLGIEWKCENIAEIEKRFYEKSRIGGHFCKSCAEPVKKMLEQIHQAYEIRNLAKRLYQGVWSDVRKTKKDRQSKGSSVGRAS